MPAVSNISAAKALDLVAVHDQFVLLADFDVVLELPVDSVLGD